MATEPIQIENVDFALLEQIDKRVTKAIEQGEWTIELYMALQEQALKAAAGIEQAIDFLREVADPDWDVGPLKGLGRKRISRELRDVAQLIYSGWEPFFALPNGRAVTWNNQILDVENVQVLLQKNNAKIIANLKPGVSAQENDYIPGDLISDTIAVELEHGWRLESRNAVRSNTAEKTIGLARQVTYQFIANDYEIFYGQNKPSIWLIQFKEKVPLPISRNLIRTHFVFTKTGWTSSSASVGLVLRGAFTYLLLEQIRENKDYAYSLLFQASPEKLNTDALTMDLLALQFSMGFSMRPGLIYGIERDSVTAILECPHWAVTNHSQVPVVPRLHPQSLWIIDLFERFSAEIRLSSSSPLAVIAHLFVRALDALIDTSAQSLLSGIALLAYNGELPEDKTYGQRAKLWLKKYRIELPDEICTDIDYIEVTLRRQGVFTLGARRDQLFRYLRIYREIRTVLISMAATAIGYKGPIAGYEYDDQVQTPPWWPKTREQPNIEHYSISLPPQDGTYRIKPDQILILTERPEHQLIIKWVIAASGISTERLVIASAGGADGLIRSVKIAKDLGRRFIFVADSAFNHLPTAVEEIRARFTLLQESVYICPAIPCLEAWLLADDELVRSRASNISAVFPLVQNLLPEELSDARRIAHQIFGPPDKWSEIPAPDLYRAAERCPSMRRFLGTISELLGHNLNLPAKSVAKSISRTAIAGLIRDLLAADTIAWRTVDGDTFTAERLAQEVEQGTETGRQYSVDLVAMMINMLSRKARSQGTR